jgi:hypothetical protein
MANFYYKKGQSNDNLATLYDKQIMLSRHKLTSTQEEDTLQNNAFSGKDEPTTPSRRQRRSSSFN